MHVHDSHDCDCPQCDKCGAEITTGLMAVYCAGGKDCEFWTPDDLLDIPEFLSKPFVRGNVCDHGSEKTECYICKLKAEIERLRSLLRGLCEPVYDELTDEQCIFFQISKLSLNDMVRAIHRDGWNSALLFLPPNAEVKPASCRQENLDEED